MLERLKGQDDIDEEGALEAKLLSDVSAARNEPLPDPPNVVLERPVVPEMKIRGARGMQISVSEMGQVEIILQAITILQLVMLHFSIIQVVLQIHL
jgi:hypothetical protein